MDWARILAFVTGLVDQELLAQYEYLVAENRILKAQSQGRLKLTDAERATLGEIGHRLGRKALAEVDVGWLRLDVGNMDRLLRFDNAAESTSWPWSLRSALPELGKCWRHSDHCSRAHGTILITKQDTKAGFADAHCIFQHGLEHGLELAGRTADDLEHVGGGGLLLKRLLCLIEQAHVFNRDYRLLRKRLQQFFLPLRDRPRFSPADDDDAKQITLAQHRYAQ